MYVITYAIPTFPQIPTPNLRIKLQLGLIGTSQSLSAHGGVMWFRLRGPEEDAAAWLCGYGHRCDRGLQRGRPGRVHPRLP